MKEMSLADRMLACVARPHGIEPNRRTRLIDHLLDTLAVAAAGWNEPVSVKLRAAFPGANMLDLEGNGGRSAAEAALVLATACHALDFDDVHLESVTVQSRMIT